MGDNLISGKFVSTFQISTQDLNTSISPKMAVKGFRSTINYKSQSLIQVGNETGDTHQQKLVFASGEPGALGAWGAQDANLNSGCRVAHAFRPGGNQTRPGATGATY